MITTFMTMATEVLCIIGAIREHTPPTIVVHCTHFLPAFCRLQSSLKRWLSLVSVLQPSSMGSSAALIRDGLDRPPRPLP